ncbi:MAG: hypothetical protein IJ065_06705 [Eubacterium sp.]|nr:hypothetical protein [Eubacterium sp.]
MSFLKKKTAILLLFTLVLSSLAGCGKKEEEPYVSPNFTNESEDNQKYEPEPINASVTDATPGDALVYDKESTGEMSEAVRASLTDALEAGVYENDTYYNSLAGLKISVADTDWAFYDAEGVAAATGLSTEDVNNFWYGYKTTDDAETSYCAIVYNKVTGSNVVISYVNPSVTLYDEITAEDYLSMALNRYDGLLIKRVTFLGDQWACLDIPADQNPAGRRICYAKRSGKVLVLVTFTMQEDQDIADAQQIFTRLQ